MLGIKDFAEAVKDLPDDVRENLEELAESGLLGRMAQNIGRNFATGVMEALTEYDISVKVTQK
jgi:hypothetical protein